MEILFVEQFIFDLGEKKRQKHVKRFDEEV